MADSRIPQRKKRRWQQQAINPPFPVPIATITGVPVDEKNWHYFTGELEGDHVVVKHSGDIHYLHKMGFFGRGLMSQGAPDFYKRLPNVFIPQDDGVPCPYKVARRRMFLRHNQWRKSHDQQLTNDKATDTGQNDEYDSDIEFEPVYDNDRRHPELYPTGSEDHQISNKSDIDLDHNQQGQSHRDTWTESPGNGTFWGPSTSGTKQGNIDIERMEIMDQSENNALWDTTGVENQSKTVVSWDADGEGDADFWGCEDSDQSRHVGASNSTLTSSKQDLLQHSNDLCKSENTSLGSMKFDNKIVDDHKTNEQDILIKYIENDHSLPCRVKSESVSKCLVTVKEEVPKPLNSGDTVSDAKDFSTNIGNENSEVNRSHDYNITEKGDSKSELISEQLNKKERKMDITNEGVNACIDALLDKNVNEISSDIKQQTSSNLEMSVSIEIKAKLSTSEMSTTDKEVPLGLATTENAALVSVESESREEPLPKLHPYCDTEDNDADFLVIDDSDTEGERGLRPVKQPDEVWKPVLKRDPFPIQEPLILSLEEAFFLSYGLGCLTVVDSTKVSMTLCDLWQRCCAVKVKFLPHYVAYHYFRSKGWVPKPGLLFGADFILYRIGPPFYHGSYSVIVRTVHEGSFTEVEECTDRKLTWTTFCGLHRVTEHVAKVLMLCYVIVPDSLTEEDKISPKCLSKFKVKLQVINRWISSQERGKEPEQIP